MSFCTTTSSGQIDPLISIVLYKYQLQLRTGWPQHLLSSCCVSWGQTPHLHLCSHFNSLRLLAAWGHSSPSHFHPQLLISPEHGSKEKSSSMSFTVVLRYLPNFHAAVSGQSFRLSYTSGYLCHVSRSGMGGLVHCRKDWTRPITQHLLTTFNITY